MPRHPDPPRVQRAVRLSADGIAAVETLAKAEHRTWSTMLRILLGEALAARSTRKVKR